MFYYLRSDEHHPEAIRKVIYTTNAIESLNSVIRHAIKKRKVFLAKGEKGTPELSLRDDPAQETLRFSADASLAFPCSDISALKRDTSGAFRMTTTFMGLQGSQSPLPGYYLDHLA